MALLVLGLILFLGVHSVKIAAPGWRARAIAGIGDGAYKGLHTVLAITGLALIVWGFARAWEDPTLLYYPPATLRYLAAALIIPSLILAIASGLPAGRIKRAVRHPLLIGTMIWAVAHLFVNGDLAGLVLFGAFLAWAFVDLLAQPRGAAPAVVSPRSDGIAIVAGLILYGLLLWRLHYWLFGATALV